MDNKLGDLYNAVSTIGLICVQVVCRAGLTIYIYVFYCMEELDQSNW